MKKFITITLKILAVVAIASAVAYGIYRLMNYEKKPIAVFEKTFDDDDTLEVDEIVEVEAEVEPAPTEDGALDAVDKCMPY